MSNHRITETTGIYSKYVFDVLLKHEIARTARFPSPLTVLRIGLAAKGLNKDLQQEAMGAIANLLNKSLRASDVPAEYEGGFVVLLPLANQEGGRIVCSRVLSRTTDSVTAANGLLFTPNVCIGMTWRAGGDNIDSKILLEEAGQALSHAQRQGPQSLVEYAEIQQQYLNNF